ncbi:MAG TPA: HD-GYP domain-containing protein, partial [Thermomicrobiales bacterium]|nr:HD-GYP domain-containing protein [Thermomicrobiales bacterium]
LLLTVLVAVSYARPLRVAHKFSYDISDVVHVAMILLFPPWLPGLLVGVAGALHLVRRPGWRDAELFNIGQVMIYVTASAVCLDLLRGQPDFGPTLAGLPPLGSIGVAAAVLLAVNLSLVAGAIALQTHARFWRLLRGHLRYIAPTYFALVALGVVAALVVRDYPVALAPLVLPAGLAQYALEREVRLRAETREALAALVDVVELRDPYTAGHSRRVAESARMLATWMGLTGEEADLIESAGRVHDLGKIAMSPLLLSKQGPLDDDEWRQVRQHPVNGAAILERFAGYRECSVLVRHHHEHWDGAGYPAGMAGDAIPLGSRILAVADAFDAMTSTRAYRPAQGPDAAMRILEQGSGAQWDPGVVAAFAECRRHAAQAEEPTRAGQPVHA